MLYHYCSAHAFKSIMDSKTIWLSDVGKSNDPTESKALLLKGKETHVESQKEIDELIDVINGFIVWAFCLSENGDLLSQWRGYANDGKGFSIGFDENKINDSLFEPACACGMELAKMKYSGEEKVHVGNSEEKLKTLIKSFYYKDSGFSEEKEQRLTIQCLIRDFFSSKMKDRLEYDNGVKNGTLNIAFNENMVSHIEVPLENLGNPVSEIIIGPKNTTSIVDLKAFLFVNGYIESLEDDSIKIRRSKVAYR